MSYEYRKTRVVKTEVVLVTPEMAVKLLNGNEDNRKLRPSVVREYAIYMQSGQWRENGETIAITKKGTLLNGQHRLHAVIASGVSVKMVFVTLEATDGKGELTALGIIQDRGSVRNHSDISGVRPVADKIAATMIRNFVGTSHAKNTAFRAAIYDDYKSEIDYLTSKCSTAKRYLSRAAIHGVITLRLRQGYDHTDRYRSVLTDLVGLPAAWGAWYKRIELIRHNNKPASIAMIALTWAVTEPGRDMDKPLYIPSEASLFEEAKDNFYSYSKETVRTFI